MYYPISAHSDIDSISYDSKESISDKLFSESIQSDEESDFYDNKLYFHINNETQNSQNSQKTDDTNSKQKPKFVVGKESFRRIHTHKKEDKDNIMRKITNQISKTGINKANEIIKKSNIKNSRLNIVTYKGKFNKEDYPKNFLNLTLKEFFSQNSSNKIIIDELIEYNHELAEFLYQKFDDYVETEGIQEELIKIINKLKQTNEQTYIDKFENTWKNLKKIINGTFKRNKRNE